MAQEKETEMDLDSLAPMVAEGFSGMEKGMNTRFDSLEDRMGGLEDHMENLESRMGGLDGRMGSLEIEVRDINRRLDQVIIPTLDEHAHRIKALEESLTT